LRHLENMKIVICLPVKNEDNILRDNVELILKYLSIQTIDFSWQIVIMVNGSKDGSLEIAKTISQQYEKVSYLSISSSGKGRGIKYCFDQYINQADYLMYMDIDLAVSLSCLDLLFKEAPNYDLVFGSRLIPGATTNRNWSRALSSKAYNYIARLIFKHPFLDLQCGFKIIKKESYQSVRERLEDNNWFFDTEWIIILYRLGFKLKEMPVDWKENRYKKRESRVSIFKDALKFLLALKKLYFRLR